MHQTIFLPLSSFLGHLDPHFSILKAREALSKRSEVRQMRQRHRWASGMKVNNRETHRGLSDKCPEK